MPLRAFAPPAPQFPGRAALGAALACLALAASPAHAQFKVLETRDLRLVYPGTALDFIAPYTAQCFENSARFHRALWRYAPSEKVTVILDDATDFSNAAVWASPRNTMVVHIAPASFVYETGPSNERMNFTMNHELVHVVALDQAAGSDRFFRGLFHGKVKEIDEHPETILYGYLTLPRRAAPRWYHEGIAVFLETWMAGGLGRAQGPYDEMVFRSMVRDRSRFYDPLGLESQGTRIDFQAGVNSYLYGTRFMTWLAYAYGPDSLMRWVSRAPDSRGYFANQFAHVYGRPLTDAWRDWVAWEHGFQNANLDSIRRWPVTPARDLSREALGSVSRAFVDSAGGAIVVAVSQRGAISHLATVPLAGGPPRVRHEIKGPTLYSVCSIAFDPDTRTVFYTTRNNDWRDLCAYDLATGRTRVLIHAARIGDLAFDRTDHSLWGVRHFNGISTVVRMPRPYREWNQMTSFPYGRDVYDLDVSPDGRSLALSMAEVSGRQTLRLFPLAGLAHGDTTSRTLYDFGTAIPNGFVWSPDGQALYGSSYFTGVSNIFRYDLRADSMAIVSNAETGFFRPLPMGTDSLIVFRYSGAGFVPAVIPDRALTDVSATRFLGAELVAARPQLEGWRVPPPSSVRLDSLAPRRSAYRALASVRPTTVYPVVEAYKDHAAFGARVNLSDPVSMHQFDLTATVTPQAGLDDDERLHLVAGYKRYDLSASVLYNRASFYDLFGPTKTARKGYGGTLRYTHALVRDLPRTLELALGLSGWGGLDRLPDYQNVAVRPGVDRLVNAGATLTYRNLRASIGAVDYEKGVQGSLAGSVNSARFDLGADRVWRRFPLAIGTLDLGAPLPMRNASVWLRTAAGASGGDDDEAFANVFFGGFGNNVVDHGDPKRYHEVTAFPGVGLDAIAGTSFGRAMVETVLPPLRFRRAGTLALYGAWARLSLFATALVTNPDRPAATERWGNVGAQTDVRFQLLTQQPLTLSFGYARAARRHARSSGEWMGSLKIL